MKRSFTRYARRALGVSSARFAREERGAVMVMTIAFALPLALFLVVVYNSGVALTHRMRAQCVADAASYSATLWQARFLNYCAYTRRTITANYATMALCTAHESALKMYYNIYDAQNLIITFNEDKGMITTLMTAPYNIMDAFQLFEDDEDKNPVMMIRKGCDVLNKMLSLSQQAMYYMVATDTKSAVMEKVVEEADRDTATSPVGGEFRLLDDPRCYSSLVLSPSVLGPILEQKELTLEQLEFYEDVYTKGSPLASSVLPLLGRGFVIGADAAYCGKSTPYIQFVIVISTGVDTDDACEKMEATESVYGYYVIVVICFKGIPIPIGLPIFGEKVEVEYEVTNPFADTKVYHIKEGLSDSRLEPSSLAVVEVVDSEIPWYPNPRLKLMPADLTNKNTIRAYSRSKVYFRGVNENLSGSSKTYSKPHTSYPHWGSKLAPIAENMGAEISARSLAPSLLGPFPNY